MKYWTFGPTKLEIATGDNSGLLTQSKIVGMLTYLALSGALQRRDRLVALLWPELDDARARNALSKALHHCRRRLGEDAFSTRGSEEVGLNPSKWWCDATEFRATIDNGDPAAALALYRRGELLDGFHLSDAPEFEQWLDEQRHSMRLGALAAATSLAEAQESAGHYGTAASHYGLAATFAPYDETILRRRLSCLDRMGDRAGALSVYSSFADRLKVDLEATPAPETQKFIDAIRQRDQVSLRPSEDVQLTINGHRESAPTLIQSPSARETELTVAGRNRWGLMSAIAVVALTAGAWLVWTQTQVPPASANRRVLVAPFENRTGDSTLNDLGVVVADWLSKSLQSTGFVEVIDPVSTVKAAQVREEKLVGIERASTIAHSTNARTVVWGEVRIENDSLIYRAAVSDVSTQTVLLSVSPISSPRSQPLLAGPQLTDAVAGALAAMLDRRLASINATSTRPPVFEAYREFVRGLDRFPRHRGDVLSEPHFLAAARIDTTFSQPLIWLGFVYGNLGRVAARDSVIGILGQRRKSLDQLEMHALDWFEASVRRDVTRKFEAARAAAHLSPGSPWSHYTANLLLGALQPNEALRYLRQIDPERGWAGAWFPYWKNLTVALHLTGQHADELRAAQRSQAIDPDEPNFVGFEIRALIGLGHVTTALQRLSDLMAMPLSFNSPGLHLTVVAQELRVHGHSDMADSLTNRALTWFESPAMNRYASLDFHTSQTRMAAQKVRALYEGGRFAEALASHRGMTSSVTDPVYLSELSTWAISSALLETRENPQQAIRTLEAFDNASGSERTSPKLLEVARLAAALDLNDRAMRYLASYIGCCSGPDLPIWLHRDREWWLLKNDRAFRTLLGGGDRKP